MQFNRLGQTGLKISQYSLGSWVTFGKQVDIKDAKLLLKTAFDAGVNFFDNAEGYEAGASEEIMGNAISALGLSRDAYILSSKVFWGGEKPTQLGLSAKHVRDACDQALTRLKVTYLDLFYCHRPDPDTPILETVRAMNHLITQGKVIYWGTSEWSVSQILEAHKLAHQHNLIGPVVEQPQYNMLVRDRVEREYQPLYDNYGMGLTTYSPLYSGILTGKYNNGVPDDSRLSLPGYEWLREQLLSESGQQNLTCVAKLQKLAQNANLSLSHLALIWCAHNPNVSSVILGASKLSQLKDNLKAITETSKFDAALAAEIAEILGA